jgi:hypothetical protein
VVTLGFDVYKFSDSASAKSAYDLQINQMKDRAGYEEVNILGSYGAYFNYGIDQREAESWGISGNIVFRVTVYSESITESPKDDLVTYTNLERGIITANDTINPTPTPTVPEFPVLILLTLFISMILFALMIRKRNTGNIRSTLAK